VNSLLKTVTRQSRGCDLNPGPTAPESSMLTTRLPSHPSTRILRLNVRLGSSPQELGLTSYFISSSKFPFKIPRDTRQHFLFRWPVFYNDK